MDGDRFDALTRSLAAPIDRRQTLKAVVAGVLGGVIGQRHVLDADAQGGPVDVCYRTGNPRKPYQFLTLDPRAAERLRNRRDFVVCESDEQLDRATCSCVSAGADPEPEPQPQEPSCAAVGEACRRNGECCSHWCWQGICQCTGSGANCAGQDSGEVTICYLTGNRFRPHVVMSVSPLAAARLKGRSGYVVCDEGEQLDTETCACEPDLGGEEPGPSCSPVGGTCQDNGDCCGDGSPCENGICQCATSGSGCDTTNDCCSGICDSGLCQCVGPGMACTNDRNCCGGSCADGTCSCLGAGADCGGDGQCCSGACDGGACLCGAPTAVCQVDADCCEGECINGRCGCTTGNCPAGMTCYEGACCTLQCADRTCGDDGCGGWCSGVCCPIGAACRADGDCCGGTCQDNGTCACGEIGDQCSVASDCCSNHCEGGACACIEAGSTCVNDTDCCSGVCLDDGTCACQQGDCPIGQVCHNFTCCTPNCSEGADECGDDGCGGVCGTCSGGDVCCGPVGVGQVNICVAETCPSDMSQWCSNGECCGPPFCPGSNGGCCTCILTTEGETACVSDAGNQSCSASSGCPSGQVCGLSCGLGNFCMPVCT